MEENIFKETFILDNCQASGSVNVKSNYKTLVHIDSHLSCKYSENTSDVVVCYKQRLKANIISNMELIGNVENKNVVLVDDMVDTAGTLVQAANLMLEKGAVSVRAICTHAIFSKNAIDNIEKSKLKELIVTDSINHPITRNSKIKVLSCADLFASTMYNVNNNKSISSKFIV